MLEVILMKKNIKKWFFGILILVGCCTGLINSFTEKVEAANMAGFDAGYIMSDYQMSNYNSMNEAQIQAFLNSKNSCGNRDYGYYLALSAKPGYVWHWADGHFVCLSEERFGNNDNEIGWGETAAHIIWQAAQDYRINPQVLIVNLQKETSLITDPIPNNSDYRKAMGYGCPDTAACSSRYYGFKNQVRNAAALFRTVLDGGWTNHPLGNNYIQYNPNSGCGGSWVNIRSLATSALYRYTPYQPNAAALSSSYGYGDGCSAYGNRNFYSFFEDWFGGIKDEGWPSLATILSSNRIGKVESDLDVNYEPHIEHYGWIGATGSGEMAGTAGFSLRMEALAVSLKNETGIEYRAHVQDIGWTGYTRDGGITGTVGQSLRMEAVQIRLTGEMAKRYDVYYRAHIQDIGWMGWVKNDEVAGTTGQSLRMEAIQIKLVKKDFGLGPNYMAHVQNIGWMEWVKNARTAGTTGQSKQMEAVQIKLLNEMSGELEYRVHVQDIGWMEWKKNGEIAGTTGLSLRMEAIQVKLSDQLAKEFDVYYRVHVQDIGWMKWVKNGEISGTTGQSLRVEAIQVELMKK